ncbi:MAG TPA: FAD-linked oxidase C-terminal domain-containing protein [Thermoleophilaceae bacterium]|nr:FAD-linked oxidase C-terminal domain-containing protein [Thermoleophilaceae bacterium]
MTALVDDLGRLIGREYVREGAGAYGHDATEMRGVSGSADAVVLPGSAEEVAALVAWCYERDLPIVPRGGGTGFAGGAVPLGDGVVLALDRLRAVRALEPELWRMHVEAGLTTRHVQRVAREGGVWFPPDPGAAEQSQIGGNIATNAGGPHAFKYGVTGSWVTGLEAVIAPGELIAVGGPLRKDVAGYDLRGLLVGSEGTLGIVTAAWLRLIPAPEAQLPIAACYAGVAEGCRAVETVLASGVVPAVLEFLDGPALAAAGRSFPATLPGSAAFMVIAEADGSRQQASADAAELMRALEPGAVALHAPTQPADTAALWRWREGVSLAVAAVRGGKLSEDIVVPVDRLAEAIEGVAAIAAAHGLDSCSWGHAGDGNLHATFMVARDRDAFERAEAACQELFALALRLGGSISGEHGVGLVKSGQLRHQWPPAAVEAHRRLKLALDPKGLFNPGKKQA